MKSIIVGSNQGCQKCEMLKLMNPNAECVFLDPAEIIAFARNVGITSLPFVVSTGEPQELDKIVKMNS